jgi:transcriptional regulator
LPARYREGMMNDIVAFEMTVTRLEGKYKLSQNKSKIDGKCVEYTDTERRFDRAKPWGRNATESYGLNKLLRR